MPPRPLAGVKGGRASLSEGARKFVLSHKKMGFGKSLPPLKLGVAKSKNNMNLIFNTVIHLCLSPLVCYG